MNWVQCFLVACISFQFTGLSSVSIRNSTGTSVAGHPREKRRNDPAQYMDSRDGYALPADVDPPIEKRSATDDEDAMSEDLMASALPKATLLEDEGDTNVEKRSAPNCIDLSKEECPLPQSYLDFTIGNEIPITMEHTNELTADATAPQDTYDNQASANLMIENESPLSRNQIPSQKQVDYDLTPTPLAMERISNLMVNATLPEDTISDQASANIMAQNKDDLSATSKVQPASDINGIAREKRDSTFNYVSPEIFATIRDENRKNDPGDIISDSFHEEDLMKAMVSQNNAPLQNPQVYHRHEAPVAKEHISALSAKASQQKNITQNTKRNYNTLKKELKSEMEMMKNISYISERSVVTNMKPKDNPKEEPKNSQKQNNNKQTKQTKQAKQTKQTKQNKQNKQNKQAKHTKQTKQNKQTKHGKQNKQNKHKIHSQQKHTNKTHAVQMRQHLPPVANHKRNELTAKSTSPKDIRGSRNSKRSKIESTNGELKSIFTEMRSAKHKLTRNDIRKLAKTAVMLAALKSQGHLAEGVTEKKHVIAKPKHPKKKSTTAKPKKKKAKKTHVKKDKSENMNAAARSDFQSEGMTFNSKDQSNQPEFTVNNNNAAKSDISIDKAPPSSTGKSEFSEDIVKKTKNIGVSDDAMGDMTSTTKSPIDSTDSTTESTTTATPAKFNPVGDSISEMTSTFTTTTEPTTLTAARNILPTTPITTTADQAAAFSKDLALKVIAEGNIIQKKSEVSRPDDDIEKAISDYDTNDLLAMIDSNSNEKKSIVPSKEVSDSMATLKSVLSKVSPNKVPNSFLPDIPSGLRMIAWKKLLEKKRSQLADYEASIEDTSPSPDKAISLNINIDAQKNGLSDSPSYAKLNAEDSFTKKPADDQSDIKDLENEETGGFLSTGGHDDIESARHVHYLKKHIQSARSLRKLIAKTLVGHCKSTGKRILSAFIAMDKALERAQAIATVIGGKFNVDPNKIENLVSDKEDQVVETFLRDIFTKL